MKLTYFINTIAQRAVLLVPLYLVMIFISAPPLTAWEECGSTKDHKVFHRMRPPAASEDCFEFAVTRQAKSAVSEEDPNYIGDNEIVATFSLIDTVRQTFSHGSAEPFEVFELETMGDHGNRAIESLLSVYTRIGYGDTRATTQIGILFKKEHADMGTFLGQDPGSPLKELNFVLKTPSGSGLHFYPTLAGGQRSIGQVGAVLISASRETIFDKTTAYFVSLSESHSN